MDSKKELAEQLLAAMKESGLNGRDVAQISGLSGTNIYKFIKYQKDFSLTSLLKVMDALDLKLVMEDREAEWGLDMRLRRMPKKLFVGARIETREMLREDGFYPRVDLFDNPESVLKFIPTPCDVYEIRPGRLIRKKFDVVDHPFGTMYSYNEHIPPEMIVNMVTYR